MVTTRNPIVVIEQVSALGKPAASESSLLSSPTDSSAARLVLCEQQRRLNCVFVFVVMCGVCCCWLLFFVEGGEGKNEHRQLQKKEKKRKNGKQGSQGQVAWVDRGGGGDGAHSREERVRESECQSSLRCVKTPRWLRPPFHETLPDEASPSHGRVFPWCCCCWLLFSMEATN